jgi:hypothetical protein
VANFLLLALETCLAANNFVLAKRLGAEIFSTLCELL